MDLSFTVWIIVGRPPVAVFEAVADPARLSRYFTTGGASGRLETGKTVMWDFHDFPGAFPVDVEEVLPNEKIVIHWQGNEGPDSSAEPYPLRVELRFLPTADGRTRVEIEESGWRDNAAARRASYGNCMGWAQMLAALKVWLEYDINLREGAYKSARRRRHAVTPGLTRGPSFPSRCCQEGGCRIRFGTTAEGPARRRLGRG